MTKEFLSFLKQTELLVFVLYDSQSSFLQNINPHHVFDIQPNNSVYSIVISRHNSLSKGTLFLEDKNANKQLFFHVREDY